MSREIVASRRVGGGRVPPGMSAIVAAVSRARTSQSSQHAGVRISRQMIIASYDGSWYWKVNSQAVLRPRAAKMAGCAVARIGSLDSATIATPTPITMAITPACSMRKPWRPPTSW